MRGWKVFTGAAFAAGMFIGASVGPAAADPGTHRVTDAVIHDGTPSSPSATDAGWYRDETQAGGVATLTKEFGGAPGDGSLELTTTDQNASKAQLITYDDVRGALLSTVTNLGYSTFQSPTHTGFPDAAASYQLRIDLDGDLSTAGDKTTLVYEPYENGSVVPNMWQTWDATGGNWWSSNQIGNPNADPLNPLTLDPNCGFFERHPGAGGEPYTRPSEVALNCPRAKVVAVGVNIGTSNPNYIVAVDGLHLDIGTDSYAWDFGPK